MERRTFSPRDLLLARKWSSLFFTTYSLSLSFLEAVALSAVARSFRSFTVLVDLEGYRSSLADAGAIGVGRSYDVVPVKVQRGVFHPKIGIMEDDDRTVRATVGSGNLTFGGWGYNTEVLEVMTPGVDSRCFSDLVGFLEALVGSAGPGGHLEIEHLPDISRFAEICRRTSNTPGAGNSRLLHTMSEPLDVQLGRMVADLGGATSLTIVSPFFSGHFGVMRLATALACERIAVAVPPVAPSIFDFEACREAGLSVSPVTCDLFSDTRSLHTKLYDIECRKGRIVVTGSANATLPALLGQNVEAVIARLVGSESSLGWRQSGTHEGHATGEPLPGEVSGPCLAAHFDGRSIIGRVFGLREPTGEWLASISSGTWRETADLVTVNAAGKFQFSPPEGMDLITLPTSSQIIFERDGIEIRGWLVFRELLHAIRDKGPIARSLSRVLSGTDTTTDICAILEYLSKVPVALLEAAERQAGGRKDRVIALAAAGISISSKNLQPISAFDMPSTWTGGGASRAFDSLLDALIRSFAASMPDHHDDAGDDEDELVEPTEPRKRRGSSPAKRGQRVPVALARKAFELMFGMLEKRAIGPDRVPGLYALFDMIVQIAPRCDEAQELTLECTIRWMAAAQGCRISDKDYDALDKCVAAIVTKWVMDNSEWATRSHMSLQRWLGSTLDESTKRALEPDALRLDERRLAPYAVQEGWSSAWRSILSTTTPWAMASAIVVALQNGGILTIPAGVTEAESNVLQSVASGHAKPDRVVSLRIRWNGRASCPACNNVLSSMQQGRLQSLRIATCSNLRCNRVITDISL